MGLGQKAMAAWYKHPQRHTHTPPTTPLLYCPLYLRWSCAIRSWGGIFHRAAQQLWAFANIVALAHVVQVAEVDVWDLEMGEGGWVRVPETGARLGQDWKDD